VLRRQECLRHYTAKSTTIPPMSQPRLVDLSHVIDGDGCQYPGLPAPVVSAYRTREETAASYAPGVSFLLSRVEMATNVGTYLDSPYHRYESGTDLAGLPLAKIAALPARWGHSQCAPTRPSAGPLKTRGFMPLEVAFR